jgi:hypothetical protein
MTGAMRDEGLNETEADEVFRLIYASRKSGAVDGRALRRIAETARRLNGAMDVTGVLLSCADAFLQVLEGERIEVMSVFKRIDRDSRHDAVAVIGIDARVKRIFAAWPMGCFVVDPAAPPSGFVLEPGAGGARLRFGAAERVDQTLRRFYDQRRPFGAAGVILPDPALAAG